MTRPADEWRVANHVLHFFAGAEGFSGGGFDSALLLALSKGDPDSQAGIGKGFPIHHRLFVLAQKQSGGLDVVRNIALGGPE